MTPRARGLAAGLALAPLAALVAAPLLRLLQEALAAGTGLAPWLGVWEDAHLRWRIGWSLGLALTTCALTLALGLPLSWLLARRTFAGRTLVLRSLMLPFVMPTLVAAMGVLALLGPRGWLSSSLGWRLQDTPWLLLYGHVFLNLCLVLRAGVEGFEQVSQTRVAAARSLGATAWRAFWRIEWPSVRPWLASALCGVFLYSFSGFGLALILGGQRYATVEVEIYTLVAHELRLPQAGALALCTMGLTGGVAWIYARMERALAQPARADHIPPRPARGATERLTLGLGLGLVLALCGAPLLALLPHLLRAADSLPSLWQDEEVRLATWNTARFTLATLLLATTWGVLHALAARRWVALRAAAFAPLVVSPVTLAFGLLLLYPSWSASLGLLLASYALMAYPFVANSVGAALDSQPANLAQVARTLGASPARVFWRVTLPLARPALRRGMAFAAASALGEFAVSLFLSRPEWLTLTTLIYQRLGRPGAANRDAALMLAAILMGLALTLFLLIERAPAARREAAPGGRLA